MTPTETAAFLRRYNVWRRGNLDDQPMPDPREIGKAIGAAVEMIDRLEAAEKAWKINDQTIYDLTEKVIPNIREKLEAAEKERDAAELMSLALRAKIEAMERQEPVEWQSRTRPVWNDGMWTQWSKCSEGYAKDIMKAPLVDDWIYEARALYALPGAQPAPSVSDGWKEAAIAWEVCGSLHREYAKGKDPFFKKRQEDFVKHANDARTMLAAPEAKP